MNLVDILLILVILILVLFAIKKIVHKRKHGNSCCTGCSGCGTYDDRCNKHGKKT